jgi:GTPase
VRFVDEVSIRCASGEGGSGCSSFRREKYVPRGGPNGGDGGRGGNVILRATARKNTLDELRFKRHHRAEDGVGGSTNDQHGRAGADCVIMVPIGTVVFDQKSGLQIADLTGEDSEAIICQGGAGGRGNPRFKSATNRTPTRADPGEPAQEKHIRLELKLIADVGLLGFPNAGKSTLISTISNARPKVADYPFTTLVPNLGVVSVGYEGSFVVADIPGLVQGASEGVGLGHRFLRHVERCTFFMHLVSASSYAEPVEDPVERWQAINAELAAFSEELSQRPQILVLTKMDLVQADEREELLARFAELGQKPLCIASVRREGLDPLIHACWARLNPDDED